MSEEYPVPRRQRNEVLVESRIGIVPFSLIKSLPREEERNKETKVAFVADEVSEFSLAFGIPRARLLPAAGAGAKFG